MERFFSITCAVLSSCTTVEQHKPSEPEVRKEIPVSRPIEFSGFLLTPVTLLAFGALLIFSFVPIPIYINCSQILLFVLCIVTLCNCFARFGPSIMASLFVVILVAISQAIGIVHSPAAEKNYLTPFLFLTSMLIAPSVMYLTRLLQAVSLCRLVPRIVTWVLSFLTIECVTRLILSPHMSVMVDTDVSDSFYLYKHSLFFVDSNFVGIAILCLIPIMFAFREAIGRKSWLLAYLLLFATLSRASIVAGVCQLVIYKLWRWRTWAAFGLLVAQLLIIVRLLATFIRQGSELVGAIDGSFATKFYLLSLMIDAYGRADIAQRLFGIGVGNAQDLIGIFAHNIVVTLVLELGIGGSLLFLIYIWILSRKSPVVIYLLVLPMVINGFSLVSTSMPYFFVALGLLAALRVSLQARSGVRAIGTAYL